MTRFTVEDEDVSILRERPLGDLHLLAKIMKFDEKKAKAILKERVEDSARKAGISLTPVVAPCGYMHGPTTGVKKRTAGIIYQYVGVSITFMENITD